MAQSGDFLTNLEEFRAQYGNELRWGGCIALMLAISAVMHSNDSKPAQIQQEPQHRPMELVASPNEPFMFEAIRIARMPSSETGVWGARRPTGEPTATFKTPGGSITLTRSEIANANTIYPQLKSNPAILHGTRSSGHRSSQAQGFSEDLSGDW
jgi:hypothetical protein